MRIKVVSLNIEGDKHLPAVEKLIEREQPDVVCLQEVFETDFNHLTKKFGFRGKLTPTVWIDEPGSPGFRQRGVFGNVILSHLPSQFGNDYYYKKREPNLPNYQGYPNAGHRALVWHTTNTGLTIATTHFTWSKGGKVTQRQRHELRSLLRLLDKVKPDILCGDFNTAQGGEIWKQLTNRFSDNIPAGAATTLDDKLHYSSGRVKIVVDGFFTRRDNRVKVESIRLVDGISDHLALAAQCSISDDGHLGFGDRG